MIKNNKMEKIRIEMFNKLGLIITRYGLAIVLIWIGFLKFTTYEA